MSSSTCISGNSSTPESESWFSRPMDSSGRDRGRVSIRVRGCGHGSASGVRVVDSKSCRQMYLRTAYTFSRQEDIDDNYKGMEKVKKRLSRVRDRVISLVYERDYERRLMLMRNNTKIKSSMILSKVKKISHEAFLSMIRRMLACTSKVDVAEH